MRPPDPTENPPTSFDGTFLPAVALATWEPGEDQRWSTWAAATPTERGPRPWPDRLETSSAALGIVTTGKEADVLLIERAVPGSPGCRLAAKRYRGSEHREFHRSSAYEDGRRMRNTRDARAVARGTAYGKQVAAGHWAVAGFDALCRAWRARVPVPYPVQISGTEVVLEFTGTGRTAAPRLAQTRPRGSDLEDAFGQVMDVLRAFAQAGFAHGDSSYTLLLHEGRVVVIDLPGPTHARGSARREATCGGASGEDRRPGGESARRGPPPPRRRRRVHLVRGPRRGARPRGGVRGGARGGVVTRIPSGPAAISPTVPS